MKACKRKTSAFKSSKYSLTSYRPITSCDYSSKLIPIKRWATINNYSYKAVMNLIKQRKLMAKKHKNRWYVASLPDWEI